MNPVLILTRNNLELTKRCVESVLAQDIETEILIVDNGSTDGTQDWVHSTEWWCQKNDVNRGVSKAWNQGLEFFFYFNEVEHVLVLNNDTVIPPYFYRKLLSRLGGFITGVSSDDPSVVTAPEPFPEHMSTGPDFSAFLIHRSAWELIGPFDERMKNYASDNDWHVRAHRKGLTLWNSGIPFYHERSSTLNNATPFERSVIELQANEDRAVFRSIYGCDVWSPQYAELLK